MTSKENLQDVRDVKDPTLRLLLAGERVLVNNGIDILATGLTPDNVTAIADRTRRVFYDHFETKDDFVRAVLGRNLEISLEDLLSEVTHTEIAELLRLADGDLFDSVHALSALTHGQMAESPSSAVQLIAMAMGHNDPALATMVATYHRDAERAAGLIIDEVFEFWGLQLREPWTRETFARVLVAVSQGLYVRSRCDPDAVPIDLVALTMLTIFPGAILPAGAPMVTVEENLRQLADSLSTSWREKTAAGGLDNAYERVLDAFCAELEERGISRVSTDTVSNRSGVSSAVIVRTFGDVTGLLRAAVMTDLPSLQREAGFDLGTDALSIDEALRRHLIRLGSWVVEHRPIALAIISEASATPTPNPALDLEREVVMALALPAVDIFAAGAERGIVRSELSPQSLAATVTQIVVAGAATNFGFEPSKSVNSVVDLIMNGCKR